MFHEMVCAWCSKPTRFVDGDGFEPRCTACGKTGAEAQAAILARAQSRAPEAGADVAPRTPWSPPKELRVWCFLTVAWAMFWLLEIGVFGFPPFEWGIGYAARSQSGQLLGLLCAPVGAGMLRWAYLRFVR